MTQITASESIHAVAFSNQRRLARTSNGVLWAAVYEPEEYPYTQVSLYYSTDNGATWNVPSSGLTIIGSVPTETYLPNCSIFIDIDDYLHIAWKDGNTGYLRYARCAPNASRTAYTSENATIVTSDYPDADNYPDLIAHRQGTGWAVHMVWSRVITDASARAFYTRIIIAADGSRTLYSASVLGSSTDATHRGRPTMPSIDFHHVGDGRTVKGSTPHLYIVFSVNGHLYMRRYAYSNDFWYLDPLQLVATNKYTGDAGAHYCVGMFDGTRFMMAGVLRSTDNRDDLAIYERDAADTTTTQRVLVQNYLHLRYGTASYDRNGNIYLIGQRTNGTLEYRRWVRSTGALEAETLLDGSITPNAWVTSKRGYAGDRIDYAYVDYAAATPYPVAHGAIATNTAPLAPPLNGPVGGVTLNRLDSQRFSWTFQDPDPADSQSGYNLRYRLVGAAAWTTVSATTPNAFRDFPAGTFAAGDYEWQVQTLDALGWTSPYSTSGFFTAAEASVAPTITTPPNGSVVPQFVDVVWSYPSQIAYRLRTVADNAGAPDTNTVYTDTGVVESTTRTRRHEFATNNRYEHVQIQTQDENTLWTPWSSARVQVAYTPPATPTLVVIPMSDEASIAVQPTNPAPSAGEPTVTYNDIYHRMAGEGPGTRLAAGVEPNVEWIHRTPGSDIVHEYRVVAMGDNGVQAESAWQA